MLLYASYVLIYEHICSGVRASSPRSLVTQQRRQRSLKHPPPPLWKCGMDVICSLPKRVHPPTPLWKCGVVFCAERRVRDVASRSGIKRCLCTCRRSMIIRKQPDLEKNEKYIIFVMNSVNSIFEGESVPPSSAATMLEQSASHRFLRSR